MCVTPTGVRKEDTSRLFATIKPHLANIWHKLYLRDASLSDNTTDSDKSNLSHH